MLNKRQANQWAVKTLSGNCLWGWTVSPTRREAINRFMERRQSYGAETPWKDLKEWVEVVKVRVTAEE